MKKKSLIMLLAVMLVAMSLLAGCGSKEADKEVLKVGLIQQVEHPSLDTIRENIISQLEKEGYKDGDNIEIDYQNAQNEPANMKTICQKFVSDKCDVIISIATPVTQTAYGETKDIPIVFSAVTDPVGAGLVKDLKNPGGNITGTSDRVSAEKIMDLALKITPDIKTIGALYCSSETNSQSVVKDLKAYAKKHNLEVKEATITTANEIQQAAQSLAGKCDAVFSPIDNTVASGMSIATDVFNEARIPYYVGADSMVNDGGLATDGINYVVLGQETGKMVAKVLEGEDPATMPIETMEDTQVYINPVTAGEIGVKIPEDILKNATKLGE